MSQTFGIDSEPPKRIKEHEWGKYNPVWMDCSAEKFLFEPIRNNERFRYLWVIKGQKRLILGIEFDDVDTVRQVLTHYGFEGWLKDQSDEEIKQLVGLGHPTLSAHFQYGSAALKSGDVVSRSNRTKTDVMNAPDRSYGEAFYGGELNYTNSGWEINNASGRHSGGKTNFITGQKLNSAQWMKLLLITKQLFFDTLRLEVRIQDPKIK